MARLTAVSLFLLALAGCPGPGKKTLQSLAITPAAVTLLPGAWAQLSATAKYSDGSSADVTQEAQWTSGADAVASVMRGRVEANGDGTVNVTARLGGLEAAATVTVRTPIAPLRRLELSPASPKLAKGTTTQLTVTGIYGDDSKRNVTSEVSWFSSVEDVATVSEVGVLSGTSPGITNLTATLEGVSTTEVVTVTAAALVSLEVTPTNPSIPKGATRQLTATGTFTDASTQELTAQASWSSSDTGVATVSEAGLVTGAGVGTASVTASLMGQSASTEVTVTAATLTSLSLSPASPSVPKGMSTQLGATGHHSDGQTQELTGQVSWHSSNPGVATVSGAGLASGHDTGTTTISATLGALEAQLTLVVTPAVLTSVEVLPAAASVPKGLTQAFTAEGTFSDGTSQTVTSLVIWSSSSEPIATVSNAQGTEGVATGAGVGTATLSASHGGVGGSATLTVTAAELLSLGVSPASPSLMEGATLQLEATGSYTDASTQDLTAAVTWASSAPAVATVSNASGSRGLVAGVTAGSTSVSATHGAIVGSTVLSVTPGLASIVITPASATLPKGTSQQLTALGTFTDGSTGDVTSLVTWTSSDEAIASVSNVTGTAGLARGEGEGSVTITAAAASKSATASLTVTAPALVSIDVTPRAPTIQVGRVRQFVASGTYSDATARDITSAVTWTSSAGGIATIDLGGAPGLAAGVGAGTSTIAASSGSLSGSTNLTVVAGPPCVGPLVNELQTGISGATEDELVELYNPCATPLDLAGHKLVYRSASGTSDTTLYSFGTASLVLSPGRFLLYGGGRYLAVADLPGASSGSGRLAGAGGGVALRDASDNVIDSLGWGSATNLFVEGAAAPAPGEIASPGKSLIRHLDGTDSNNNLSDFVTTTTPTPRAANVP